MRSAVKRALGCWMALPLSLAATASGNDLRLVEAIKTHDAAAVRALLNLRVDVNQPEPDGTTALHWAVQQDDLDTADLLIRAGALVTSVNRYGVAPLSLACANGNAAMIERLLKAGADPDTAQSDNETALMTAARNGRVAAVSVLLAHGARVNAVESRRNQTALMWAVADNNVAAARALLEHGADVGARSGGGFTALLFAARAGHLDAVRLLVDSGADLNDPLPDGTSALLLAIANAHYELAAMLLDRGATVTADALGRTALHELAWARRPDLNRTLPSPVPTGTLDSLDLAKALLAHGADPNARLTKEPAASNRSFSQSTVSRIGATPFWLAAKAANLPLMRLLLANGADASLATKEKTTALMVAAGVGIWVVGESPGTEREALEATTLALDLGGDVNAANENGDTALHGAAVRGANSIVQLLVDKGARLDATNKKGWTPLTIADGVFTSATFKRQPQTAALLRQLMSAAAPGSARPPQ